MIFNCHVKIDVMNDRVKGYLLAALSAATYGMNPLFAIPLYDSGMNTASVLLFRYILAIPILGLMIKMRGRSFALQRNQWLPVIILGILVAVSSLALFQSYNYMNSGIASTLLFVYPIMVALIMGIMFHEKLPVSTWCCIGVAGIGIAMLCKASGNESISVVGITLVMVSALSYAVYMVGVNRRRLRDVATLSLTFYTLLFGVMLFIVMLIFAAPLTMPSDWYYWGNLLGLAAFPTAISFLCATAAIQYIGSTPTAILGALEPVTAIIFSVTILNQPISVRDSIGMALIILAVTLVIAGGRLSLPLMRIKRIFPRLRH